MSMSEKGRISVYVRQNKVYVVTVARTDVGFYLDVEPVYVTNYHVDDLAKVLEKVCQAGNPIIKHPAQNEIDNFPQPVLIAAKTSSWKKFAKNGAHYLVSFELNRIGLEMSKLDQKGRLVWNAEKRKSFLTGTNFHDISKAILDDASSRPELQSEK